MVPAFPNLRRHALPVRAGLAFLLGGMVRAAALDPAQVEFFEQKIRPLLADHCYECHSARAEKIRGALHLDTRAGIQQGGASGPLLVPGHPEQSLLVQVLRGTSPDIKAMPAKQGAGRLPEAQIAAIEEWIRMGAPDPRDEKPVAARPADRHWAFQKPVAPAVPSPTASPEHPARYNAIDDFIQFRFRTNGLAPMPEADRRTLLRRVTFDLTGLPPTPAETAEFLSDPSPKAYETLVDRLLASPRYGERWGRHWLDVARYADSKGYVFEQERRFSHSFTYRDWVVNALNQDLPYDRFLVQQIAGDQIATPEDPWPMAAQGFLTLGRRFLDNTPDIIDDRLDVVFRGTQGLTVACARCHDHKFDPIPTADYYSLYGVFNSSHEPGEKPLLGPNPDARKAAEYEVEREKRRKELTEFRAERTADIGKKLRERIGDYLLAAQDSLGLDWTNLEGLARVRSLDPGLVAAWKGQLEKWRGTPVPAFRPWFAFAALGTNDFAPRARELSATLRSTADTNALPNPIIVGSFAERPPGSMAEVAERYGTLILASDTAWKEMVTKAESSGMPAPTALADPAQEELRGLLYAPDSPITAATRDIDRFFDTPTGQKLRGLQRKIDELDATHPGAPLRAMALLDNDKPSEPVIFKRGNPGNHGPAVPRQFLGLFGSTNRTPFSRGSGRLELAEAIASRDNPLTARVMVNRVWQRYFNAPLVGTPSDFGVRCDPPTNPELLDHLAVWFMDHGWSLKQLHRYILLSATYRQSSDPGPDPEVRERFTRNESVDPGNVLLWRMNRKRTDFESLRDSLLAVSGRLDSTLGGQPVPMYEGTGSSRRTLYGFIDRQNLPGLLRAFDFASPDTTSAMRFQTTTPQQALFLLNSPFMADRARDFAARPEIAGADPDQRIQRMYSLAFQRAPSPEERTLALDFVQHPPGPLPEPAPALSWSYGSGRFDATSGRLEGWRSLPHFTGEQWQWEAKVPSSTGLWTLLTRDGGHPGFGTNGVVRRWTAPFTGSVRIQGTLNHPADAGDGVIGRIVSSRQGLLGEWTVQHGKLPAGVDATEVQAGETLDFVVEAGKDENSDSFEWKVDIARRDAVPAGAVASWNSRRDFSGPQVLDTPLDAWQELAQVLLSANEFVFVD